MGRSYRAVGAVDKGQAGQGPSTDLCDARRVTAALEVRGLVHSYDGRRVLDEVDLDAPAGRVVGLLGPNGAGKTTLMRILFGVVTPDSGEVRWQGRRATATDRRRWGYRPQERGLYREMRVIDHLVWLARLSGIDRPSARQRALGLLERLELGGRARDPIRELSGGLAQRVQLAAAMVHEPELLVLDEPFAGLDPGAIAFLTEIIAVHTRAGGHVLFSSHQLDLVEDLCEEIVLVDRGRVVLEGPLRNLRQDSPDRFLRVDADVDPGWLQSVEPGDITVEGGHSRIRLPPGSDAAELLAAIQRRTPVHDFGVESPRMSDLFLAATGASR